MVTRGLLLALVVTAACARFDVVQADQCGNGVIEEGEDCDRVDEEMDTGGCVACRLWCDPSDDDRGCPEGWGCGDDNVCRHTIGQLQQASSALDVQVDDYVLTDLDGDPFVDALGYGPSEIWMARGTSDLGFELVDRFPRSRGDILPAFGDVDGASVDAVGTRSIDLVTSPGARAVALWNVAGGRLQPLPQPWFQFSSPGFRATPARTPTSTPAYDLVQIPASMDVCDLSGTPCQPGEFPCPLGEACVFGGGAAQARLEAATFVSASVGLALPDCPTASIDVIAADLDGDDVDEVLFTCTGSRAIQLLGFTVDGGGDSQLEDLGVLTLADPVAGPVVVALHDGDARLDVLVTVLVDEVSRELAVFHQTGPMSFGAATPDVRLGAAATLEAAADLDDDGVLDMVASDGIYLDRSGSLDRVTDALALWDAATIADVNGDTRADVIAISDARVDTLLGTASGFAGHVALTTGDATAVTAGDLDGDGYTDAATLWADGNATVVRILYGQPDGVFGALVSAGATAGVPMGFHAADIAVGGTMLAAGGASDLVLALETDVLVFTGSGIRPPVAPLDALDDPRALVLGSFDPGLVDVNRGMDLMVLTTNAESGTVFYGSMPGERRDLADRYRVEMDSDCAAQPSVTAPARFLGRNLTDIVELSCASPATHPTVYFVPSTGTHELPRLDRFTGAGLADPGDARALAIADLDGDVAPEVLFALDDGAGLVLPNLGGNFGLPAQIDSVFLVDGISVGNIDLDDAAEIVVGGEAVLAFDYARDGDGAVITPLTVGGDDALEREAGIPRLFDVDHDGVLDLVLGGDQLRVYRAVTHTD